MKKLLEGLHRVLGRSEAATRIAVHVRNQARAVVAHHLGSDLDPETNGEVLFARQIAPESKTFIDVGANVGDWTAMFMGYMKQPPRGMLFDPSEVVMERLQRRFGETEGLRLVQAAASDSVGRMSFFEEPGGTATSSLVARNSDDSAVEKSVRVTTLDQEVQETWGEEHIDFLKIDAEGYDLHALRGASNLLARQQVGVIQFEYNTTWVAAGSTLLAALELLKSKGYESYLLKRGGLFLLDYLRYGEFFSYSNFVAVSPRARHKVAPLLK